MEELQRLQSARLKRLLDEQGISQKDLAEKLGVSPTSINHWVNGKVHMNDYNASLIHGHFPEYSAEWLRGYSDYPNRQSEINAQVAKEFGISQCVERLAMNRGFQVSSFGEFDPKAVDMDKWREDWPNVDRSGFEYFERLEDVNGRVVKLTAEQWNAFVDEVGGYIEMRINSMIGRGAW